MHIKYGHMRNKRVQRYSESYAGYSYEFERFIPPIYVRGTLFSRWGPGDNFSRVNRRNMSLNLVTYGNAHFVQDGREGVLYPGDLFFAQRGSDQIFKTGDTGVLHKRTILIDGPELDSALASAGLSEIDFVRPQRPSMMISLFREAHRVIKKKPPRLAAILSRIGWEIILLAGESIVTAYPPQVARAIEFIRKNLHSPLKIDQIAAEAGLSVRHCTRVFREHLNCSPVAFFLQEKMAVAENMVANTRMSNKAIATALGYEDPLYFSLQFKKFYGLSPTHYRENHSARRRD